MPSRIKDTGKNKPRVPSRVIAETHKSIGIEMHGTGGKDPTNTSPTSDKYFLFTCLQCGETSESRVVTKTRAIDEGRGHRGCVHCGARYIEPHTATPLPAWLKAQALKEKRLTPVSELVTGMKELRKWKCSCRLEDGSSSQPFVYAATVAARSNETYQQNCPRCAPYEGEETLDQVADAKTKGKLKKFIATLEKSQRNIGYLAPEVLAKFPLNHKAYFCCIDSGHVRYCSLNQMLKKDGCLTCFTESRSGQTLADKEYAHLHDEFVRVPDYPDFEMQDVPAGSRTIAVEWACRISPQSHRWQSYAFRRTKEEKGCPFCAGKVLADCDSLAARYPEIALEFDAADNQKKINGENADISSAEVRFDSASVYSFECIKGHKYRAKMRDRTAGKSGCTQCELYNDSLAVARPDLAKQWHRELNARDFGISLPETVPLGSNKKVWWRCQMNNDHAWLAAIKDRARSKVARCLICRGKVEAGSKTVVAEIERLRTIFDESLNGMPASQAPLIMRRNYYWRCATCGKSFRRRLEHMLKRSALCPEC